MVRTIEHTELQPTVSSAEPLDFSPLLGPHLHLKCDSIRKLLVL